MTQQHITQEVAVALARKVAASNGDTLKDVPEKETIELLHGLANAAIQHYLDQRKAEPTGWQAIETAPKDGRPILLFGDCRVTSGHWSAPSETPRIIYQDGFAPDTEWDEWEPYWASWDGGFTEEHPPTHWMPLPAAPKEQQ